ncbi:MAG: hypothetical protein GX653_02130 [Clostridiales bacterium]|nr:hypothetical protein [Clostridiales bacterium]
MNRQLLEHYVKLTAFLGQVLGPDYEVALHDLTDKSQSLIAIANSHISGRQVGAPLTNMALKMLMDREYEQADYRLNYRGETEDGRTLRSSTLFIKHGGRIVGMLCINFDHSKYLSISESILQLCHPNAFVETNFQLDEARITHRAPDDEGAERIQASLDALAEDAVAKALAEAQGQPLAVHDRLALVRRLEADGIFLVKGAVGRVAGLIGVSQATLYRDLKVVRR